MQQGRRGRGRRTAQQSRGGRRKGREGNDATWPTPPHSLLSFLSCSSGQCTDFTAVECKAETGGVFFSVGLGFRVCGLRHKMSTEQPEEPVRRTLKERTWSPRRSRWPQWGQQGGQQGSRGGPCRSQWPAHSTAGRQEWLGWQLLAVRSGTQRGGTGSNARLPRPQTAAPAAPAPQP